MNSTMSIEDFVLSTLSFYEPMTFSRIILDFKSEDLLTYPEFDKNMLSDILKKLEKKKLIRSVQIDKEQGWIRIFPRKSWLQKLSRVFNLVI